MGSLFNFPKGENGEIPDWINTDPEKVRRRLSTREGWSRFVNSKPTAPALVSWATYQSRSANAQRKYNQDRIAFHRSLVLVQHSQLTKAWSEMSEILNGSYADDGPGWNICLTGGPSFGKSSIITGFGRQYEQELLEAYPAAFEQENKFIPVCYSSLTAASGLKGNMKHILSFYGEEPRRDESGDELVDRLTTVLADCQTQLLILDQAQNLKAGDKKDEEVAKRIKHLMDDSHATIAVVGIDLDTTGPLSVLMSRPSTDREALARRFALTKVDRVPPDSPEWVALLRAAEGGIRLLKAKSGDLSERLAPVIWDKTEGAIGSTFNLIHVAANAAIMRGEERITETLLRKVAKSLADAARQAEERAAAELAAASAARTSKARKAVAARRAR